MKDMTNGNPLKILLLFALPLYIGQQFQLLYGLVDMRIHNSRTLTGGQSVYKLEVEYGGAPNASGN